MTRDRELQLEMQRSLWRIRMLLSRVDQDCGERHPELHQIAAALGDGQHPIDADALVDVTATLRCAAFDCTDEAHCELLRRDLVDEVVELSALLRPQRHLVSH